MVTRHFANRVRLLVAALGLAIATTLGASGIAAAANPNGSLDATVCVTSSGDLLLTANWSGMRVTDYSWFIESTDGSGGTGGPVAQPGRFGFFTHTFPVDPNNVSSVNATVYGAHAAALASVTLTQPLSGWPDCGSSGGSSNFDVTACVTPSGDLLLTANWSGMRVTDYSWFIESTDGSGGIGGPVPQPGRSGTFTNTFLLDPAGVSSVNATVLRAQGSGFLELANVTLTQPLTGWPPC